MKIKAVVLEDDDSIRALTCEILKDRGYEVYASSEPFFSPIYLDEECICPEEYCTTIVITDINMPNMTGLEFIEHQRSMGCKFKNVAVMSGRWTKESREHANRLGCQMFSKPFKVTEIKKWLDECEERLDHKNTLSDMQRRYN